MDAFTPLMLILWQTLANTGKVMVETPAEAAPGVIKGALLESRCHRGSKEKEVPGESSPWATCLL